MATAGRLLLMPETRGEPARRVPPMRDAGRGATVAIEEAGIDARLGEVVADRPGAAWCWAACVGAIARLHGQALDQRRIVGQLHDRQPDLPAWGASVAAATTRRWLSDDYRWFACRCDVVWDGAPGGERAGAAITAARLLADGHPPILGASGHAVLLTAITFARDGSGNGQPLAAVLRDPWPGAGRRALRPADWTGARFLAKLNVFPDDPQRWWR